MCNFVRRTLQFSVSSRLFPLHTDNALVVPWATRGERNGSAEVRELSPLALPPSGGPICVEHKREAGDRPRHARGRVSVDGGLATGEEEGPARRRRRISAEKRVSS